MQMIEMNKYFVSIFIVLLSAVLNGCSHKIDSAAHETPSSHHTSEGFVNPYLQSQKRGFFNYLKMRFFSDEEFADYEATAHKVPTIEPDLSLIHSRAEVPRVTWVGHATVLVQYKGIAILTDPMFSSRASPVNFAGPERVNPPALEIKDLPPVDLVVISHNHYDHLDAWSVRQLGNSPFWVVPLGLKSWFLRQGISADRVMELDWWDSHREGRVTVTATPAQHWSARSIWDRNESLWASWMVQVEDFTFWYSGDTGYNPRQFKEIGNHFPSIDLALISIGAYAPRWFMKDVHITPEEAVQIHQDIGARQSLAVQWGTFPMTSEPIDEPPKKLSKALGEKNIDPGLFSIMKIGETRMVVVDKRK